MSDPKLDAINYLEHHKIRQLFQLLGAKVAFVRPDDPNKFLAAELLKVSAMMSRGQPVFKLSPIFHFMYFICVLNRSHYFLRKI
jgi:hypothetical protein